mmetsp:Transcript_62975/g.100029  ORF Transcript_62975/g.100029 Transcript_62975/m.100029 type:complete len:259 (-) Transcript_62975:1020-1796(-)|eukprot:CAMPEP_0197031676 /NCGR_PEP_ID=MMETSP1384-20130603/10608_1 /TAXON_ID=29189 /ORGANISM="Ammonia sp." /LENGTH=258 /DNA_ID=CAMNT_0042461237 /DNA_START=126 /DNA_END=902 /DNA_ORIENTATION=-
MSDEEQPAQEQEEQPEEQAQEENGGGDEQQEEPAAAEEAKPEPEPEAEAEAPAEEPAKEEAAAAEEVKEEPKAEPAKKKKSGKKKKKAAASAAADSGEAQALWDRISAKKGGDINWYAMELAGKPGTTTNLKEVQTGSGGAKEIIEFAADKSNKVMFVLLKAVTTDDSKSVRSKFIFIRIIGSGVKTMTKAKLTPALGKIDDHFPCKHLTLDLNEKCEADLAPEKLARELLRVGGAHKPDQISFGPGQDIDVKSYKNN